jgi:hypothetical protein
MCSKFEQDLRFYEAPVESICNRNLHCQLVYCTRQSRQVRSKKYCSGYTQAVAFFFTDNCQAVALQPRLGGRRTRASRASVKSGEVAGLCSIQTKVPAGSGQSSKSKVWPA